MILTDSVRLAKEITYRGDFRAAIDELRGRWQGVGVEPERNGESDVEYAHLLMVCGILAVELGRIDLTPSQAGAKDLLSKAVRVFGEHEGRHEARFWLGVAYLRCGENHEALALVDEILAEKSADSNVEFCAGRLKGLACLNLGDFETAESAFQSVVVFIDVIHPMSRGKYYLNRGMLFRQTGRFEQALSDYGSAIEVFRTTGSLRYEAAAQNNMAGVFTEQNRLTEARTASESALSLFAQLNDKAHEAKVWDQIAQIHGREQNFTLMETAARRAVDLLSESDHEGWLAEALITHGTALSQLGLAEGRRSLERALEICDRQGDSKQAQIATQALWETVKRSRELEVHLDRTIKSLEREVYERVLSKHSGHISAAARELGYSHQAFQRRLQNHFPDLLSRRHPPQRRRKSLFRK